jgi:EmrB/QacA subfamily drug resistance transporter
MDRRWWTLTAVSLGVFMLLLDVTIVNVALSHIQQAFTASLSDLQWVIDAYALTLAALLLMAGSIADRVGRRRMFAVGITLFTLASLLCGLAPSAEFLSISRGLQGVGGAIMFATSLALLAQAFPPDRRGVAFGVFGAVTGVAVAVGPVLGGALTSWMSWRWIFFVNLPVGAAALLVTVLRVDESRDPKAGRPDWPGFATFSVALAALVYGLIESDRDGWRSTTVITSLSTAAVLLIGFALLERRSPAPMFDLRLLRVPTFGGGLLAAWAISASIFSLLTFLMLYLQNVLGYSPLQAGLRVLPLSLAVFFAAAVAGRLSDRVPARWLIAPGFVLVGAGILLMRGIEPGQSWTHFVAGFVVAGIGAGFINVPLASTALGVVSARQAGMASGMNSTLRQVGIATGVATLGSIFSTRLLHALSEDLASGPLAARAHGIAAAVTGGRLPEALSALPGAQRAEAAAAVRDSFATALNDILFIGAMIALAGTVLTFVLIRQRDFVAAETPGDTVVAAAPQTSADALVAAQQPKLRELPSRTRRSSLRPHAVARHAQQSSFVQALQGAGHEGHDHRSHRRRWSTSRRTGSHCE